MPDIQPMPPMPMNAAMPSVAVPFENYLEMNTFRRNSEKTHVDKLLGREEVERLKEIIKKADPTREELLELLNLLTGIEQKLVNYSDYDRYILGKYFTWIRDLVKICEFLYDYEDRIKKENYFEGSPHKKVIMDTLTEIKKMQLHNTKFSIDVFLFLSRSTMSLEMVGFGGLSTQSYKYDYGQNPYSLPMPQQGKKGLF